jgi:hypothetical protein
MNNEQFERRMEFIVEQQAQFTVDIQALKETQAVEAKLWREKYNVLTDALATVVGMVGKLAANQDRTDAKLAELAKRTDERLIELAERQSETDERLNIFVNVVERYLSGNGKVAKSAARRAKPTLRKAKPKRKTR